MASIVMQELLRAKASMWSGQLDDAVRGQLLTQSGHGDRVHRLLSNKNRIKVLAGGRVLVEIAAYELSLA